MAPHSFHPAVQRWFDRRFSAPTEAQLAAWPYIQAHRHTLIAAPTGSGKTLAAFLAAIDDLTRQALAGHLPDSTQVLYVSPLKALSNDVKKNLEDPLAGIRAELAELGLPDAPVRTLVRTGDTSPSERAAMTRKNPHILVTTPESMYILLTSDSGRRMLSTVRTVIVDEIHAVADDRRGSHLALSLERLAALTRRESGREPVRIGLSATQNPIEEVARFLVGAPNVAADGTPDCVIVDTGHRRAMELAIEVPESPLEAVMSAETWKEIYDRLAALVKEHRTTLIFVNTRRLAERITRHLSDRIGLENVAAHHGSLSREQRLDAEQRLKTGELSALVATASLELGIDIGSVDLVCQISSPRSIATFLQRAGRSGHTLGGLPKARLFPVSRDDLVECTALIEAVRAGELDRLMIPPEPLSILAQQIVAAVAAEEWREDDLFDMVRRAWPYRNLTRGDFDEIVAMLADGFSTRRGRRGALIHRDAIGGRLRPRRGTRLTAITSGGAIPDNADYRVILEPTETFIGTLNEDFAFESQAGDIFQLGNASWRILKVEQGRVLVEDAKGLPPSVPFWLGEAPGRTRELSEMVSRFRAEMDRRIGAGTALTWLVDDLGLNPAAAVQLHDYLAAARGALGVIPTQETLVIERFFDEAGDMHMVVHSPFGSRLNRAWGLALRKRFCRKFNFELQAAATEDAVILSLGPTHSFQLEDVFRYLNRATVRDVLTQALLAAPMFPIRWRWNAGLSLAIPRFRGGRRVPPRLQRMEAEDLIAVVFPDQLACAENLTGDREIPDHPLVRQTLRDCLEEAMDIDHLEELVESIATGGKRLIVRDLTEPSPLAHEILNARPWAFLDDAPLEERRTQAVMARRWLDPDDAARLGALDLSAIERVRIEAWPDAENADELHDVLMQLGFLTTEEVETGRRAGAGVRAEAAEDPVSTDDRAEGDEPRGDWLRLMGELVLAGRATRLSLPGPGVPPLWTAAERLPEMRLVYPEAGEEPRLALPAAPAGARHSPAGAAGSPAPSRERAVVELLRGRLEVAGPVTADELARLAGLDRAAVEAALVALETEGFIFRGRFTPGTSEEEWCERRLLARIHRYTIDRLRKEIEPVSIADFNRFLLAWQRVSPDDHAEGPEGLAAVLDQLEGYEAPAAAWERDILPARLVDYDPVWLDSLCLSGRFAWTRPTTGAARWARPETFTGPAATAPKAGPVRRTPIAIVGRENLISWAGGGASSGAHPVDGADPAAGPALSANARRLHNYLLRRGASFFGDMVRGAGLLRTQVEEALGELVAQGLVSSDSFAGLRALLVPSNKRPAIHYRGRRLGMATLGIENAGRWFPVGGRDTAHDPDDSLDRSNGGTFGDPPRNVSPAPRARRGLASTSIRAAGLPDPADVEVVARALLRRYGVVFRKILDREGRLPAWRSLLEVYRRLEARGEIRGGRFVSGPSGEQYALPDAVARLRAIRRSGGKGLMVSVSAADPVNLLGIITPGDRVTSFARNRILFKDGVPVAIHEAGATRFLVEMEDSERWHAEEALLRRRIAPRLRPYLGRSL